MFPFHRVWSLSDSSHWQMTFSATFLSFGSWAVCLSPWISLYICDTKLSNTAIDKSEHQSKCWSPYHSQYSSYHLWWCRASTSLKNEFSPSANLTQLACLPIIALSLSVGSSGLIPGSCAVQLDTITPIYHHYYATDVAQSAYWHASLNLDSGH